MKLTDEQIQDFQRVADNRTRLGLDCGDMVNQLIADRQAWKEESERYAGVIKILERDAIDANEKLNQAVRILTEIDAYMDFSEEIPNGESMGEFVDASSVNAAFKRAYEFLSQEGESHET